MHVLEEEQPLGEGPLSGSCELPFSIRLPYQPLSHDGQTVWVDWNVTARVTTSAGRCVSKTLIITVLPARVSAYLAHKGLVVAPYRQSGAGRAVVEPLWKVDTRRKLQERLGDDMPFAEEVLELERRFRRQALKDRVGAVWSAALLVLAVLLGGGFLAIPAVRGLELLFWEGEVAAGLVWMLFPAPFFGIAVFYIYKIYARVFRRLRHGAIRLSLVEPPLVAGCGETPQFALQVQTTRERPVEKIRWETRYFEEAARKEQRTRKGDEFTITTWDTKPVVVGSGRLEPPGPEASAAGGAVLRWSADIGEHGPCSLMTDHRRVVWETRVWLTSAGEELTESCDFVVLPLLTT